LRLQFFKYQGTGNDFIIFDNREGKISLTEKQIARLCDRRFGVGADGLMMLQLKKGYDFDMFYSNSDGKPSSMCGNGGRCLVRFAHDMGIHKVEYLFSAVDGDHEADIEDDWINLKMNDVNKIENYHSNCILNTGSPHFVKPVGDVRAVDVFEEGRRIRYSDHFKAEGINVNFVEQTGDSIYVRTYERGVENETLSCGTGVTASALVFAHNENGFNHVSVETPGGKLAVEFDKTGDHNFTNIWLCGPAEFVFRGEIDTDL